MTKAMISAAPISTTHSMVARRRREAFGRRVSVLASVGRRPSERWARGPGSAGGLIVVDVGHAAAPIGPILAGRSGSPGDRAGLGGRDRLRRRSDPGAAPRPPLGAGPGASGGSRTSASGPRRRRSRSRNASSDDGQGDPDRAVGGRRCARRPAARRRPRPHCGREPQGHPTVSGPGWKTRPARRSRRRRRCPRPAAGGEGLSRRPHRLDPVDPEQPVGPGPVAVGVEVPGAERVEHPGRVDPAGRHLVAGVGVVVDLDALVASMASRIAARCAASPTSIARRPVTPTTASSLSTAVARGPSASAPGTAEQGTGRGDERDALGGREPQRAFEVLGESDVDRALVVDPHVDQPVGGVGRQPAHRQQLEVLLDLAGVDPESIGELVDGRPGMREDVRARSRARGRGADRRAGGGSRRVSRRRRAR